MTRWHVRVEVHGPVPHREHHWSGEAADATEAGHKAVRDVRKALALAQPFPVTVQLNSTSPRPPHLDA